MNREKRSRMVVVAVGAAFVVGILTLAHIHTPSPKTTTPEQDALMLSLKAETIRTENDLRNLEKLAYEYEIAYKHHYNGAKALYFKSLVEPVIIAAGDRRDAIRAEEDILRNAQYQFKSKLADIDAAWCMTLGTTDDGVALVLANEERIAELQAEIAALELRKQELGAQAWSGAGGKLDEKCLEEIGRVEKAIVECNDSIAEYEHSSSIIMLAYRLQRGEELVLEVPEVPAEECVVEE